MELGAIFVGLAMLVASVPFVARPFQEKQGAKKQKPSVRINPDEKRLAVLSALRDLDFDFRTGKVGEDDYTTLRAQLVAEAALYIQPEQPSVDDEQIEAMIEARKASRSNTRECSNCGNKVEADSQYCSQCGKAVAQDCPFCSKPVHVGDHFCTTCGARLESKIEVIV